MLKVVGVYKDIPDNSRFSKFHFIKNCLLRSLPEIRGLSNKSRQKNITLTSDFRSDSVPNLRHTLRSGAFYDVHLEIFNLFNTIPLKTHNDQPLVA